MSRSASSTDSARENARSPAPPAPPAPIDAAASSSFALVRATSATRAPAAASLRAVARPIPDDAPVTSATLCARSMPLMLIRSLLFVLPAELARETIDHRVDGETRRIEHVLGFGVESFARGQQRAQLGHRVRMARHRALIALL